MWRFLQRENVTKYRFIAGTLALYLVGLMIAKTIGPQPNHKVAFSAQAMSLLAPAFIMVLISGLLTWYGKFRWLYPLLGGVFVSLGFHEVFDVLVTHCPGDDAYTYSRAARYIIENRTLECGDVLMDESGLRQFRSQPGYRYVLALGMLCFEESRLMQLFFLFVLGVGGSHMISRIRTKDRWSFLLHASTVLALTLAAGGFALFGICEWLFLPLFALLFGSMINQKWYAVGLILGLIVFIRQDLFPFIIIVSGILLFKYKAIRILPGLVLMLVLPLVHNSVYADVCMWNVDYADGKLAGGRHLLQRLGDGLSRQLGFDRNSTIDLTYFAKTAFIPFSVGLCVHVTSWNERWARTQLLELLLVFAALFIPTALFGWGYYPRFELVNCLGIVNYALWMQKRERSTHPSESQ